MNHNTASRRGQPAASTTDHIAEELRRYDEHLRDVRGLAEGTRRGCIRIADRLLRQKFGQHRIDLAKLRPDDVRRFLAAQLDARPTASNASKLASALRSYFRYRTSGGDRWRA